MASTYSSNLGITLMGSGDQAGTWGTTTNTNLGTIIEEAISGYTTQVVSDSGDTTITIPNGASGVARNMSIELTGSLTAARNLIVPSNKKLYFIYNNTSGGSGFSVTVKTSSGTGVSIAHNSKAIVVCDGTNVVSAVSYIPALSLGSPLPFSSGGTGATSVTANAVVTGNSAGDGLTSVAPGADGNVLVSNGTTWASTTPSVSSVTGTLAVANGGTGLASPGASGNILTSDGTVWTSSAATPGVPSGAVMPFAMNSAPTGWLSCDGSAVSRTTYAALFTAISTTYGTGDGSTTFNLPDLRGYFVRGSGTNSDGTASGTFGAKQADAFKDHTHTTTAIQQGGGSNVNANPGVSITGNFAITSSGASTGSGTETRPRNIPMLYCIKT